MLVPRNVSVKGDGALPQEIPLPRARPKDIIADGAAGGEAVSAKTRH
jgi:hypothetical protein